ncbi:tRNAHis guanylyltransferase [Popillia japonica]|uniref:tRNA(His) guanylyltransferase n=1 Tax=Popillia japonica TaxID=7064 RepID=A0AAW1MV41_POPJA
MAKSKYEYVKQFESDDKLLPNCWLVVRIDGKGFNKFSKKHKFEKPNDRRALFLMNRAAVSVMEEFKDIILAYGQSDEYSFVFRKDTDLYNRRASKITTCLCSLFSSSYVFYWPKAMEGVKLQYPPAFDARAILYPTDDSFRDYLIWRQVDCHINNLYNTTFWALVQKGGLSNDEAEKRLKGTVSSDKNEILFSAFGVNYNDELPMYKKGTILLRKRLTDLRSNKSKVVIIPIHQDFIKEAFWEENPDFIKEAFWEENPEILGMLKPGTCTWPVDKELPDLVLEQYHFKDKEIKAS